MPRSFAPRLCLFLALAAAPLVASAQLATTLTLEAPRTVLKGDGPTIRAKVTFPGDCPTTPGPTSGTVTLHGGYGDVTRTLYGGILRTCSSGSYSDEAEFSFPTDTPGDFTYSAEYSGMTGYAPATSATATLTVLPYFSGALANGTARLKVARGGPFGCAMHQASLDAAAPADIPAVIGQALGEARYSFSGCAFECGFLCWPDAPRFPMDTVTLELAQPVPPDATVWVHATGSGMTSPVWRHVAAAIDGANLTFALTGNDGDHALDGTVVIAANSAAARTYLQDLWWGGAAQNGWGLDISQQGDRIFAGLFAYRSDGTPVWVVMPGGTWDSTHTVFSGALYGAIGSSFRQYDASRLNVQATGSARLTFSGPGAATFDYTLGTESGRKSIVRQPVGSTAQPVQGPHAGLWWGGSTQNGWGITIAHQDNTLFAVWYTYEANGSPTWFVMSGGSWLGSPDNPSYSGTLYRTSGSPFLGGTYDPSKLVVTPVGYMGFTFYGSDVAYMTYSVDGQVGRQTLYRQPF